MNRIFNMDNKFFVFMGRVADLIILNLICLVCCIPIVTIGASLTALFYVTLKMVRNEESYIIKSFFKSFKENFKQSTIINLIMLVTAIMLFFDLNISHNLTGTLSQVLSCIFIAFTFLYLLVFLYIYPLQAKFYNTIKNTFSNSLLMAIRHLPQTIIMLIVSLIPVAVLFIPDIRIQATLLMLVFLMGMSVIAYINSKFFVKIFDKYIPEEKDSQEEEFSAENTDGETALPNTQDTSSEALPHSGDSAL
ncbi:MAG TPA: DUF624 domain-containing protein [Candidatus Blautia faecavium]|uniref:DUF624 domain-containing protein n=1 Tax=Candidatus Blautia faecavium TaxID=2838487 RepID=A0A9D2LW51_9FIRM|nr:DUF624 domain-containing protein [Candidatus Blautia faecavium]